MQTLKAFQLVLYSPMWRCVALQPLNKRHTSRSPPDLHHNAPASNTAKDDRSST